MQKVRQLLVVVIAAVVSIALGARPADAVPFTESAPMTISAPTGEWEQQGPKRRQEITADALEYEKAMVVIATRAAAGCATTPAVLSKLASGETTKKIIKTLDWTRPARWFAGATDPCSIAKRFGDLAWAIHQARERGDQIRLQAVVEKKTLTLRLDPCRVTIHVWSRPAASEAWGKADKAASATLYNGGKCHEL